MGFSNKLIKTISVLLLEFHILSSSNSLSDEPSNSSVVGSSHVDRGQEKQDNSHLIKDNNGNISFCISDGAGSSKNSEL
ncbi:MAG: hypothetical protein HN757_07755, partial [Calditrichaeota bacterium]|nr:hypothetical protein [Calditrichota bacterium]